MPLANLAQLVEGGIPQQTVTLLSGSPGTGKSTLALQLASDHLASGGSCILLTTEVSPSQMLQRAGILGIPLRDGGDALWFLDCYSWRAGRIAPAPNVAAVPNLADLSSVSILLTDALTRMGNGSRPLLVVLDTPSTFALHAPPASILKFLEVTFAKVRSAGGSVLVPVEKDMHDEPFTAALATMSDGVLQFKLAEENDDLVRYLRVLSMRTAPTHSSKWTRVRLTKGGAELLVAQPSPAVA